VIQEFVERALMCPDLRGCWRAPPITTGSRCTPCL